MLGAIQGNVIEFDNRSDLVDRVLEKVKNDWVNDWRNEIVFFDDARASISPKMILRYGPSSLPARFYHITVKNLHKYESARSCVAYLDSYEIISGKSRLTQKVNPEPVELKWEGMKTRSVLVPPRMVRRIDAVYVYEANPKLVHVGINHFLVDSSNLLKQLDKANEFHLTFVVYSDNFSPIKTTYVLKMGQAIDQIIFYKK